MTGLLHSFALWICLFPQNVLSNSEHIAEAVAARQEAFRSLVKLGNNLYYDKSFHQAVAAYESAFQIRAMSLGEETSEVASPDDFIMYGITLYAQAEEKAMETAVDLLEEGKVLFPEHVDIHYNLGCYHTNVVSEDTHERALEEFNWVLERNSMHHRALVSRAVVLMHLGKWDEAVQSIEAPALEAKEKFGSIWYGALPWLIRQHQEHLADVPGHLSRIKHLQDFARSAFPMINPIPQDSEPEALVLEFGVAGGESLGIIARTISTHRPDQLVHGFDSFIGLPEAWIFDSVGEYTQEGVVPEKIMPGNVRFHVGWFNETLLPFLTEHPNEPVAALHLDADIYSSTKEVLEMLVTRLQPGCIIRFDEYFLIRSSDVKSAIENEHEYRAWKEIKTKHGIEDKPISWHQQAVTFKVLKNPSYRLVDRVVNTISTTSNLSETEHTNFAHIRPNLDSVLIQERSG